MDFALSEEQRFLQSTIADLLSRHCPLDTVRECVRDSVTNYQALGQELLNLGVQGIVIPEEFGGTGLGYLEAALVAESLGSSVAPYPYVSPSVVAPFVLQNAGSDEQKSEWLPKIASGTVTFGIAFTSSIGDRDSIPPKVVDDKLTGRQDFVVDGSDASHMLVATCDKSIYIVDATEVECTLLRTIDRTRSLASIELNGIAGDFIPGSIDTEVLSTAIDIGRIMLAADTLGAAQTMLEKSVAYAQERKQFNRVIGSFQAVKHMCAEMAAQLEPCRSLVWYAAHSVMAIPDETHVVACHAKAHLSEVGQFVARKSTEVHGGMGFTDLLGLHYWFKRIGLNRQLLGTPDLIREEAAIAQGW